MNNTDKHSLETPNKTLSPNFSFAPPALREITNKISAIGGINLGQGVCRMPVPQLVLDAATSAIQAGQNLYAPAQGIFELRQALAKRLLSFNKIPCSPENILVTNGATGGLEAVCETFLKPGDEIVSFIPYYPYHHNALLRSGAKINYVKLTAPDWTFDLAELKKAVTQKTKFILLNTPNNPTGKVFSRPELEVIAELCKEYDVTCITDEVYEYMTYDGLEHISMASLPEMSERTITLGSYSKTFAITGWRIGYLAAPTQIVEMLKPLIDQIYICAPTPFQHAVAQGIEQLGLEYYAWIKSEYTRKRSLMLNILNKAGFRALAPQGAYYMLGFIDALFPNRTAEQVVQEVINKTKVGAVPAQDFVGLEAKTDPKIGNFFRFCYSHPDEVLEEAGERLGKLLG